MPERQSDGERLFAVGSKNPVKLGCVADAVREFWPAAQVIGVEVDSGVGAQPDSERQIYTGAFNRARAALAAVPEARYGVGLEGGVLEQDDGMWAFAWAVVVDRDARVGKGKTGHFLLPEGVAGLVREGLELGAADDRFFGRSNSKQQEGAIGILSDGRLTRHALYRQGVVFALLRFLHPEYYEPA